MNSPARFRSAGAMVAVIALLLAACSRSPNSLAAAVAAVKPRAAAPAPAGPGAGPLRESASVRAVLGITDPRLRGREFARALCEWIGEDPEAALEYVRQLPPGPEHTTGVLLVLGALGTTGPDRALTVARELVSNREERSFYNALFAQLAATDPAAAVGRLALVPPGDARERAVRALTDTWAAADLPAALAWAEKLEAGDRAPAMEAVLMALASTDPRRAVELARENLSGAALDRTLTTAIQALTRSDPPAAAAIVSSLPPGEAQAMAAFEVARALAARAPGEALAWMQTLPAGPTQRTVLNNILEVWVAQDPSAAGQYVAQMGAGPARDAAVEHAARLLAGADPIQAARWARALAGESEWNRAAVVISSTWAQRDPAAAAQWVMTEASAAPAALRGVLSYWRLRDPAAARDWLAAANLSPELKARLLAPPR